MLPQSALVSAICLALLGLALPLAATAGEPLTPTLLPGGGLGSPDGSAGYFPAEKGGIEALDLATGKALWASQEANRPLAATGERLYAQASVAGKANQVRVVALEARTGKRVLQSDPAVFPDWVSVGVVYGRTFASGAVLNRDGLLLIWEARAHYAGGAAPPPEIEEAARKEASGVLKVDLETGKVQAVQNGERPKVVFQAPIRATVGGRTLTITDEPAGNAANPLQVRRRLQASDAAGRVLWQRMIAAPVQLIPPP